MAQAQQQVSVSFDEYLAGERDVDSRSEYTGGEVYAMAEDDPDDDPYYRTNPLLIVEVLSQSTRRTDLKEKLDSYSRIDTLLEYVVVS